VTSLKRDVSSCLTSSSVIRVPTKKLRKIEVIVGCLTLFTLNTMHLPFTCLVTLRALPILICSGTSPACALSSFGRPIELHTSKRGVAEHRHHSHRRVGGLYLTRPGISTCGQPSLFCPARLVVHTWTTPPEVSCQATLKTGLRPSEWS
jgi:hypothetical protein